MMRAALLFLAATFALAPAAAQAARSQVPAPPGTVTLGAVASAYDWLAEGNARGDAAAAWIDRSGGLGRLLLSVRPAGAAWTAPEELGAVASPGRPTDTRIVLQQVVVGADGTAFVAWATQQGEDDELRQSLRITTRAADGTRDEHELSGPTAPANRLDLAGDLALKPDGTLLAIWTSGVASPPTSEAPPNGSAYVAQRAPGGGWGAPTVLGGAQLQEADSHLGVSPGGTIVATWLSTTNKNLAGSAPLSYATRRPGGGWGPGDPAAKLTGGGYGSLPPLVDDSGRFSHVALAAGFYGIGGAVSRQVGAGLRPAKPTSIPSASRRQTLRGTLGGGQYLSELEADRDEQGRLVAVFGNEPPDVEQGGFGIGALWSATRDAKGKWSLVAVDALGETTGAMRFVLGKDDAGRLTATWAASSGGATSEADCASVVYRAVRGPDGRWSPRTLITTLPVAFSSTYEETEPTCRAARPVPLGGPAPEIAWFDGESLRVAPVATATTGPAPKLAVTVGARTWRDVREARGLTVRCTSDQAGLCSVSVIRALSKKPRSANCFAYRAAGPVPAGGGDVVLPRFPRCGHGSVPPTSTFTALVAYDAPGRPPTATRVRVKLRR